MKNGFSAVSSKLFALLGESINDLLYGSNEYILKTNQKIYKLDCVLLSNKKVIEFYGDYWHANPSKFDPSHMVKRATASSIWQKDAIKEGAIAAAGFSLLVVWESDFLTDPEGVISRCQSFLLS